MGMCQELNTSSGFSIRWDRGRRREQFAIGEDLWSKSAKSIYSTLKSVLECKQAF